MNNKNTAAIVFEWVSRILLGVMAYLAIDMHSDVKTLSKLTPVLEQRIKTLEDENKELKAKVFFAALPAKKEDFFSLTSIIKKPIKL